MRRILGVLVIVGCVVHSTLGWAEEPAVPPASAPASSARSVTLDGLIDDALIRSPEVQATRRAYEAARARVVSAWLPDDPEAGVDVEGQSQLFRFDRTDNEYMVAQRLPFPTTLWLRGRVAMKDADMAFQRFQEAEREITWHVEQPYYDFVVAKQTVRALEETTALLERLSRSAQARYESNKASQTDLLKAEIERAKLRIDVFQWQQKTHLAQAHLSHILNEPLETRYDVQEPVHSPLPAWSAKDLEPLATRRRPELKTLELGIARAKLSRWLARTSWLPEVTGRIEARQFSGEHGIREYDTFLGVTVPVWSLLKGASGEWKGAGQDVQEAEAMYLAGKNDVLLAIHEALTNVQSADYALDSYEHVILPEAKQQVEVALAAYEAGTGDFLGLIDAQRMLRDLQVSYYTVRADYERGLSDLRLATGGPLPDGDATSHNQVTR